MIHSSFKTQWNVWRRIPANIRLDEDVLETSWRPLLSLSSEDVFNTSSRRLDQDKYILRSHTSSKYVLKASSRRLDQDQYVCLSHTPSRRLQDIFKTFSRCLQDVLQKLLQNIFKTSCQDVFKTFTSSRYLQDVFKTFWRRAQDIFKTSCKDVFRTFSRRIIRLNSLPRSHFWEIYGQFRKIAIVIKISHVLA